MRNGKGSLVKTALPLWLTLALVATSVIGVSALISHGLLATNILSATVSVTSPNTEVTIDLNSGWNMVSLPVVAEDMSAESILSEVGYYQLVTWSGTQYSEALEFEPGKGYWLLSLVEVSIQVSGTPVEQLSIDLTPGWNMIGGLNTESDAMETFPSYYQLYAWDGGGYIESTVLEPSDGYWALVLIETIITLP